MSDVMSSVAVGVAGRYAAQIRELLALPETQLSVQRVMPARQRPEAQLPSQIIGPLGSLMDLRV